MLKHTAVTNTGRIVSGVHLGRNFSFNICDTGHHQDSAAFYGIAKTHLVVEIRLFQVSRKQSFSIVEQVFICNSGKSL